MNEKAVIPIPIPIPIIVHSNKQVSIRKKARVRKKSLIRRLYIYKVRSGWRIKLKKDEYD